MKYPIVFAFPENNIIADAICKAKEGVVGEWKLRNFPDGETYLRVTSDVENRDIIIVCTLYQPNEKFLPLIFLCKLLRDLKASSITLIAPYLAYMRQDKRFNEGEAITSEYFAESLSPLIDRLITIDPHLHRRNSLSELYHIPCDVLHASKPIAEWIKANTENPLLIGPDSESEQWISDIASRSGAKFVILEKKRLGDNEVEISIPYIEKYRLCTPVLVDDIISTAATMITTAKHLKQLKMLPPVCIGVHPIFANEAYQNLVDCGASKIISCNTIIHGSNTIDISPIIVEALN